MFVWETRRLRTYVNHGGIKMFFMHRLGVVTTVALDEIILTMIKLLFKDQM